MKALSTQLLSLFLLALMGSCIQEPEFSTVPTLTSSSVRQLEVTDAFTQNKKDSVIISLAFRDGDGNLGITSDEFGGKTDDKRFQGKSNYEVRAYRRVKGVFTPVEFEQPLATYFFPLRRDGKAGPIEGTLEFSQDYLPTNSRIRDTLRFDVRILDRDFQASNWLETQPFIVFPPRYKRQ
jgi:hypothetical protein